jgi:D-cysteine desulfhydrase
MNFVRFPRRIYLPEPTPLQKLPRFSAALGGPSIYIKRDDFSGLTMGGNKIRKLEFLVADALAQGADTLITCGAIQSNHCRLTLAAAVREGLNCQLVLKENVPGSYDPQAGGNILLFRLLAAEKIRVIPAGDPADPAQEMQLLAQQLAAEGRKAYIIPMGGSTPLGAVGYAACAQEIWQQSRDEQISFAGVVCPSASAGTHAGLLAGFWGLRQDVRVVGINVMQHNPVQEDLVVRLAQETVDLLGISGNLPRGQVICNESYLGQGYSLPTPEMVEAVRLLAKTEGILLDPVYTGKAMAGLIDFVRKGFFKASDSICFVHTGGVPSLFSSAGLF